MSLPNPLTDPPWAFTLAATLPDNTSVQVIDYINALRNYIANLEQRMHSLLVDLAGGRAIVTLHQ